MQADIPAINTRPTIIPRDKHTISRAQMSRHALKVLYRLQSTGFQSYLVGGGVRDLLLGMQPKDFDVVTNAHPEQIRTLFRNCVLIGRRFRLAHIRFGKEIIEVSTFRARHTGNASHGQTEEGRIVRDNVYGTIEEDVMRRDFTVNAMFYNIRDFSIVDYVGAMQDIKQRILRLIGSPITRYTEDPVRLLRAVRFAAKLDFTIHSASEDSIPELAHLLDTVPGARLFEETQKLFFTGHAVRSFQLLRQHGLFGQLFPQSEAAFASGQGNYQQNLIELALQNTDNRFAARESLSPGFLIAVLFWVPVRQLANHHQLEGMKEYAAIQLAADSIMSRQVTQIALPRRVTQMAQDTWTLQARFAHRTGKRALKMLAHESFRSAYDLLSLRLLAGEPLDETKNWWDDFKQAHPTVVPKLRQRPRRRARRSSNR